MKHKTWIHFLAVLGLTLALSSGMAVPERRTLAQDTVAAGAIGSQAAVGAAFTYQGRLTDGGSPANDDYDFEFKLYDALNYGSPVSMGDPVSADNGACYFSLPLLSLDVALTQGDCPLEARVSVDQPLCPSSPTVTGRVTGTVCGDAALTIRYTNTCDGSEDLLAGAGYTTADGAFTVPLSETLQSGHMGCGSWIDVAVECPCGPVRATSGVAQPPRRFYVPVRVPQLQTGQTRLAGQWDSYCTGATLTATDQQGHVLGTGVVQDDGSFVILLLRPLETNEMLILFVSAPGGPCGFCYYLPPSARLIIGPVAVPEPSTLLLFTGGLAGLAAMAMAGGRRRFARR